MAFTESELKMIAMMGQQYPCVKYVEGTVYDQLVLDETSYVILSSQNRGVMEGYNFGSPTRMYETLINIACKMGCL